MEEYRPPPSEAELLAAARRLGLVTTERVHVRRVAERAGVSWDTARRFLAGQPVRPEHEQALRGALGL